MNPCIRGYPLDDAPVRHVGYDSTQLPACLALSKKCNKLDPASLYGFVALAIRLPELLDVVLEQDFDSLSGHATVYMIQAESI